MPIEFIEKIKQLPDKVKNLLFSTKPAEIIFGITTSYGINSDQREIIAQTIGEIFIRDIPVENFFKAVKEKTKLSDGIAAGVCSAVSKELFLPLADYFPNLQNLINQWQGLASPPTEKRQSLNLPSEPVETKTPQKPTANIVKKDIRAIVREHQNIIQQLISKNPISAADSPELVNPSVKNWLRDYIHKKGAGFHSSVERSDYLYHDKNTQWLSEEERQKISQILKSYDDKTLLSVSLNDSKIIFEGTPNQETTRPASKLDDRIVNLKQ